MLNKVNYFSKKVYLWAEKVLVKCDQRESCKDAYGFKSVGKFFFKVD